MGFKIIKPFFTKLYTKFFANIFEISFPFGEDRWGYLGKIDGAFSERIGGALEHEHFCGDEHWFLPVCSSLARKQFYYLKCICARATTAHAG